jgi:hypothetical protein
MGLVRELFDELISLPKQADHPVLVMSVRLFSGVQINNYYIYPTEKYVHLITERLLWEAAISSFLASILRIKFKTYIK